MSVLSNHETSVSWYGDSYIHYDDVIMGAIVSNHQPRDCLLNPLFRRRSKKTSKLCITSLCAGNSPGTYEFPTQMASNVEIVSIWWLHHVIRKQRWHHILYQRPESPVWSYLKRNLIWTLHKSYAALGIVSGLVSLHHNTTWCLCR